MLHPECYPDGLTVYTGQDDPVVIICSGQQFGNINTRFGNTNEVATRREYLKTAAGVGQLAVIAADHGIAIADLSGLPTTSCTYDVDGLVTDNPHLGLLLAPADCNGLIMYGTRPADHRPVANLLHAGWRGADLGIHLAGLEHIETGHGISRRNITIFAGPSIGPESYVYTSLPHELQAPEWKPYIEERADGYHIHVLGRILGDFAANGINVTRQVYACPIDTGDPKSGYFSHARSVRTGEAEGRNGIMVAVRS